VSQFTQNVQFSFVAGVAVLGPLGASVDVTDARKAVTPSATATRLIPARELGVGDMMGAEREPFGVKQRLMLEVCRELDPTQKSGHTVDEGPL